MKDLSFLIAFAAVTAMTGFAINNAAGQSKDQRESSTRPIELLVSAVVPTRTTAEEFYDDSGGDPKVFNVRTMVDTHVHIFEGRAYAYCGHDSDPRARTYTMPDWRIFSSSDLVHWRLETVIDPALTYLKAGSKACWACDAAFRNNTYYFYFSDGKKNHQTGVLSGPTPSGPFTDPLGGKPLIRKGLTSSRDQHDPTIYIEDDPARTPFILFGTSLDTPFHIAQLNDDMISLAKPPQTIGEKGYGSDQNHFFKRNGIYYLTVTNNRYVTSKTLLGPYSEIKQAGGYGGHGNNWTWHNQSYRATNNQWNTAFKFRKTLIVYTHFREDGSLVNDVEFYPGGYAYSFGVGRYDANWPKIQAEWFFDASRDRKHENAQGGFEFRDAVNDDYLDFRRYTIWAEAGRSPLPLQPRAMVARSKFTKAVFPGISSDRARYPKRKAQVKSSVTLPKPTPRTRPQQICFSYLKPHRMPPSPSTGSVLITISPLHRKNSKRCLSAYNCGCETISPDTTGPACCAAALSPRRGLKRCPASRPASSARRSIPASLMRARSNSARRAQSTATALRRVIEAAPHSFRTAAGCPGAPAIGGSRLSGGEHVLRSYGRDLAEPLKIRRVQRENCGNSADVHGGNQPGIMYLHALDLMKDDQLLPTLGYRRKFGKQGGDSFNGSKSPERLFKSKLQASTRGLRWRADVPELTQILKRRDTFMPLLLERSHGSTDGIAGSLANPANMRLTERRLTMPPRRQRFDRIGKKSMLYAVVWRCFKSTGLPMGRQ